MKACFHIKLRCDKCAPPPLAADLVFVLEIQFCSVIYFIFYICIYIYLCRHNTYSSHTHTHTHDHIWMFISRMYMNLAHMVIAVRLNLPTYADFINTREVNHVRFFTCRICINVFALSQVYSILTWQYPPLTTRTKILVCPNKKNWFAAIIFIYHI